MKKIEVLSRQKYDSYLEVNCIFRFNLPSVMQNDADTMTKIPELLDAYGYGYEGTSPNFIITKSLTLNYNSSMTLGQIGNSLISKYNLIQGTINNYQLNNDDKMLCASWDGSTWIFNKSL